MATSPSSKQQSGLSKYGDLKGRLIFLALALVVYRIGAHVPVPGIDPDMLKQLFDEQQGGILGLFNMFSGGALSRFSVFALGIMPYISAAIIMQMLSYVLPSLEALRKEGESGRRKITQYTRYGTLLLGLFQGFGIAVALESQAGLVLDPGFMFRITTTISLLTGTMFLMWLGEQINDKGIGNGISIILFAGIVSRIPALITQLFGGSGTGSYWSRGGVYYFLSPFVCVILILMVAFIVWMDNAERRIPVQYAKRVVGRKMYGGQNTHIPIKVNMSGVMPIIFAGSILSIPPTIQMFIPSAKLADSKFWTGFFKVFTSTHWAYGIIYFILIIAFAYFYSSIQYNPIEMSQNIAKNGGMIPGIRTGRPTSDYIARIISRITLLGALLLSVVAIFPIVFSQLTTLILTKTTVYADGMNVSLGGTSIIILVGVALETVKQLESQMMMRHYKGFLD